jgi:flagellar basal-body rod protein FlgF/flagellar basal-body rod protein FlgG
MDSGIYAACAGLVARTQALDLAANNLANTSTTAFRSEQPTFHSALASRGLRTVDSRSAAMNQYSVLGGTRLDLAQGNLESTGNPLDVAIEGSGFLTVKTQSGTEFTRNGNFHLSPDRSLLTEEGDPVLGENGPVQLPDGEVSISSDGTISVGGAVLTKLKIVEFAPGTPINHSGGSYYSAPLAAAVPAAKSSLRQGMLEASNVNSIQAAVGLIALQRNAEMLNRTMTLFHNEFNRLAAEELPRV